MSEGRHPARSRRTKGVAISRGWVPRVKVETDRGRLGASTRCREGAGRVQGGCSEGDDIGSAECGASAERVGAARLPCTRPRIDQAAAAAAGEQYHVVHEPHVHLGKEAVQLARADGHLERAPALVERAVGDARAGAAAGAVLVGAARSDPERGAVIVPRHGGHVGVGDGARIVGADNRPGPESRGRADNRRPHADNRRPHPDRVGCGRRVRGTQVCPSSELKTFSKRAI